MDMIKKLTRNAFTWLFITYLLSVFSVACGIFIIFGIGHSLLSMGVFFILAFLKILKGLESSNG